MPRKNAQIPAKNVIVVYRIRFDRTIPEEYECAQFLKRAEPRHLVSRIKKLLLLGYKAHRDMLRTPSESSGDIDNRTEGK